MVILLGGGIFAIVGATVRTGACPLMMVGTRTGIGMVFMDILVGVGVWGDTTGVRTTTGARTGVCIRRTGAGAISTAVGRRTIDVGIGTATEIIGVVGSCRCGRGAVMAVGGDCTGSDDGNESTFCSLNDGAVVTMFVDGAGKAVLDGDKDDAAVGKDIASVVDTVGELVVNTLNVGAGWGPPLSSPNI